MSSAAAQRAYKQTAGDADAVARAVGYGDTVSARFPNIDGRPAKTQRGGIDSDPLVRVLARRAWATATASVRPNLDYGSQIPLWFATMRRYDAVLVFLVTIAALGTGCSADNPVGRICDLRTAQQPSPTEVFVVPLSPDCESQSCLHLQPSRELPPGVPPLPANSGLCTAECSGDDDCDRVPESPCVTGFSCRILFSAGPNRCRRFCVCKDYLLNPDLPGRPACDA